MADVWLGLGAPDLGPGLPCCVLTFGSSAHIRVGALCIQSTEGRCRCKVRAVRNLPLVPALPETGPSGEAGHRTHTHTHACPVDPFLLLLPLPPSCPPFSSSSPSPILVSSPHPLTFCGQNHSIPSCLPDPNQLLGSVLCLQQAETPRWKAWPTGRGTEAKVSSGQQTDSELLLLPSSASLAKPAGQRPLCCPNVGSSQVSLVEANGLFPHCGTSFFWIDSV